MWNKNSILFNVLENQLGSLPPSKLYDVSKSNRDLVQRLSLWKKLPVHKGCVNTICWNDSGQWLLSGSDDQHLVVTNGYTHKVLLKIRTGHRANIFSAKFLPNTNDKHIVSCSGDGVIIFTEVERPETSLYNVFNCHFQTAYEVTTVPNDPHTFLSCGEDGTVRWFDLRIKNKCAALDCKEDILIKRGDAVTALAVNHLAPYLLGVGCEDKNVCIYDRRMLGTQALGSYNNSSVQSVVTRFTVPELEGKNHIRITSLSYSPDGQEMLVSYSSDYIYLFNTKDTKPVSPLTLSKNSNAGKPGKSVKRLRVRGDWSDTGPMARPEAERESTGALSDSPAGSETDSSSDVRSRPLPGNLMQRMSEVLNRFFHPSIETRSSVNSTARQASQRLSQTEEQRDNAVDTRLTGAVKESSSRLPTEGTNTSDAQEIAEPQSATSSESTQLLVAETPSSVTDSPAQAVEPLVNLQYSGRGLNSGIITLEAQEPSGTSAEIVDTSVMILRELEVEPSVAQEAAASGSSQPDRPAQSTNENAAGPALVMEIQEWDDYEDMADDRRDELEPEGDGRQSRRTVREEDIDDSSRSSNSQTEQPPTRRRNPREILIGSVNDVLKHFREERQQEKAYLASVAMPPVKQKYCGHRNSRTMIKESTFWGNDYVMSGSDCGHIFIWDRYTAELVMIMEADRRVVNCLQPHPFDPILASSGIDHDIKLWAPISPEPSFNQTEAEEIVRINEIMLEETKDTITVPASFMIRMLTSLNHYRSRAARNRSTSEVLQSDTSSDDE